MAHTEEFAFWFGDKVDLPSANLTGGRVDQVRVLRDGSHEAAVIWPGCDVAFFYRMSELRKPLEFRVGDEVRVGELRGNIAMYDTHSYASESRPFVVRIPFSDHTEYRACSAEELRKIE